jgi:hypothetical protein
MQDCSFKKKDSKKEVSDEELLETFSENIFLEVYDEV